jgi:hypothetical protein
MSQANVFAPLNELLGKHFYKPDFQAIRIVLGTLQAHYLKVGDSAWLFLVAPPGCGKTTMSIMGASELPQVLNLGDFSENSFLSGFYGHQQPGLLEKLGNTTQNGNTYTTTGDGIILVKDFTTVLSMRREKRAVILSQFREMHDGEFKRDFGTGVTKIWRGRLAIIAAVTPALDRHYSIFSTLGERFLQIRWHRPDSAEAGEWAINQQGSEEKIRSEARRIITDIFNNAENAAPKLPNQMRKRIVSLAEIVAIGRTHIYRNGYGSREIEYVPEPEANTRVSKGLAAICKGIAALNNHSEVAEEDLQDALRIGMDCLPEYRRQLFVATVKGRERDAVPMPPTMRDREIEELVALEFLKADFSALAFTDRIQNLVSTAQIQLPGERPPICPG